MSRKIYIDAGHGGVQPGACNGKRKESDDVLRLALKVQELLATQDCEVKMSRTSDVDIDIDKRTAEANAWGADYFLSIHRNSLYSSSTGDEIWIYSKANEYTEAKAKIILDNVCKADGLKNRGVKRGAPSYRDYAVNRDTKMHSALIELGFISNPNDNKVYDAKLEAIALAIAKSVLSVVGGCYVVPGDVNGDGKVTAADAREALRAAAKIEELNDKEAAAADMNGDGKVTAHDAREILKKASGVKT